MSKATHYVDNSLFLSLLIERRKQIKQKGNKVRVTEELGEILLKICTNLSHRQNFIGYHFKADMISDAVDNCLTYIDNFDPEKSNNPFAYFSQIAFYAFVRRISTEGKQVDRIEALKAKHGTEWHAYTLDEHDRNERFTILEDESLQ